MHPHFWNQFESVEDYLEKRVIPKGMTFDDFRKAGVIQPEEVYRKYEKGMLRPDGQIGFLTRTGRFELWSTAFPEFGEDPLPYYMEPPFSPYNEDLDPAIKEEYPLILTTGARTYVSFHSEHRQIQSLRDMVGSHRESVRQVQAARQRDPDHPAGRCSRDACLVVSGEGSQCAEPVRSLRVQH